MRFLSADGLAVGSALLFALAVACACAPAEEDLERLVLTRKDALGGRWQWRMEAGSPGSAPVEVELAWSGERELRVTPVSEAGSAPIAVLAVMDHVDVVRCYDGCNRTCTLLNDTDRPWVERSFAIVDWGDPMRYAHVVRPSDGASLPNALVEGDFCARAPRSPSRP